MPEYATGTPGANDEEELTNASAMLASVGTGTMPASVSGYAI